MPESAANDSPPRVLIAGCGDLGCELGRRLLATGLAVTGLRRSEACLPAGMQAIRGDVTRPEALDTLAALQPQVLVYCVASGGRDDASYRAHYVEGLRNVLAALVPAGCLRHVFFVSSTRVYGERGADCVDENTPAVPDDFGGRRLLEAEALLRDLPCPATALRLSGIYGPGRRRMITLATQPTQWPAQNGWTNRIHRDDAAGFMAFLIAAVLAHQAVAGCYVVTDDRPTPQYEVLHWLAQRQGVDAAGIATPPVHGGKRLSNARLRASGFVLQYPDYRAGYGALLDD